MAIRKPINMAFPFACRERPPHKVEWVFLQPIPQPNALHSRRHDDEVQLYAFDILALDGEDLRALAIEPTQDLVCSRAAPMASLSLHLSRARSAPTCSRPHATWDLRAWSRSVRIDPTAPDGRKTGSKSRTASIPRTGGCRISSDKQIANAAGAPTAGLKGFIHLHLGLRPNWL
jgi:hypothetical protein